MIAASLTGGPAALKRAVIGAAVTVLSFVVLGTEVAPWRNLLFIGMLRVWLTLRRIERSLLTKAAARAKQRAMMRFLSHFALVIALLFATSVPSFARVMPMCQSVAMTASDCMDHGGTAHQDSGHSRQGQMALGCFSTACVGSVSLPASATAASRVLYVAMIYYPSILPRHARVCAAPDAPPPKPLVLS